MSCSELLTIQQRAGSGTKDSQHFVKGVLEAFRRTILLVDQLDQFATWGFHSFANQPQGSKQKGGIEQDLHPIEFSRNAAYIRKEHCVGQHAALNERL